MTDVQIQPFVKWAGGKRSLLKHIEPLIPSDFKDYYEPFLGAGALLMHLQGSGRLLHGVYASDISEPLMLTYNVIKYNLVQMRTEALKECYTWENSVEARDKFIRNRDRYNFLKLNVYKNIVDAYLAENRNEIVKTRSEVYLLLIEKKRTSLAKLLFKLLKENEVEKLDLAESLSSDEKIELACLFCYLNKVGFNGMYRENKDGLFNIPPGTSASHVTIFNFPLLEKLSDSWRQHNFKFLCCPYETIISNAQKQDLIYLDPPYDGDKMFTAYNAEDFRRKQQLELKTVMDELTLRGCYIILSNAGTPEVKEMYKDYHMTTVYTKRSINSKAEDRCNAVEEVLIYNFEK